MNNLVLKCLTVLQLALFTLIVPQTSFGQIIYGLDRASQFQSSHRGPFLIYAGSFQVKNSAYQLQKKIAASGHYPVRVVPSGRLSSVVVGPLSSAEMVRKTGRTLSGIAPLSSQQPKKMSTSLPVTSSYPSKKTEIQVHAAAERLRATVLLGGSSYSFDDHQQIVFPADTFRTDSFEVNGDKTNFAGGVGIAYEKIIDANNQEPWNVIYSIALGVNGYYDENSRHGSVYEYSLADFDNSTYEMRIKNYRVMFDAELALRPLILGIMPFGEVGIGASHNILNFQNRPRPDIGADGGNYNLAENGSNCFAYEVGGGFRIPLNAHYLASARYLYVDSGSAKTGIADNETGVMLATPIRTHVHSQSVLFGLSYLFG